MSGEQGSERGSHTPDLAPVEHQASGTHTGHHSQAGLALQPPPFGVARDPATADSAQQQDLFGYNSLRLTGEEQAFGSPVEQPGSSTQRTPDHSSLRNSPSVSPRASAVSGGGFSTLSTPTERFHVFSDRSYDPFSDYDIDPQLPSFFRPIARTNPVFFDRTFVDHIIQAATPGGSRAPLQVTPARMSRLPPFGTSPGMLSSGGGDMGHEPNYGGGLMVAHTNQLPMFMGESGEPYDRWKQPAKAFLAINGAAKCRTGGAGYHWMYVTIPYMFVPNGPAQQWWNDMLQADHGKPAAQQQFPEPPAADVGDPAKMEQFYKPLIERVWVELDRRWEAAPASQAPKLAQCLRQDGESPTTYCARFIRLAAQHKNRYPPDVLAQMLISQSMHEGLICATQNALKLKSTIAGNKDLMHNLSVIAECMSEAWEELQHRAYVQQQVAVHNPAANATSFVQVDDVTGQRVVTHVRPPAQQQRGSSLSRSSGARSPAMSRGSGITTGGSLRDTASSPLRDRTGKIQYCEVHGEGNHSTRDCFVIQQARRQVHSGRSNSRADSSHTRSMAAIVSPATNVARRAQAVVAASNTHPPPARVECDHCHRRGHTSATCWDLHPELRRGAARPGVRQDKRVSFANEGRPASSNYTAVAPPAFLTSAFSGMAIVTEATTPPQAAGTSDVPMTHAPSACVGSGLDDCVDLEAEPYVPAPAATPVGNALPGEVLSNAIDWPVDDVTPYGCATVRALFNDAPVKCAVSKCTTGATCVQAAESVPASAEVGPECGLPTVTAPPQQLAAGHSHGLDQTLASDACAEPAACMAQRVPKGYVVPPVPPPRSPVRRATLATRPPGSMHVISLSLPSDMDRALEIKVGGDSSATAVPGIVPGLPAVDTPAYVITQDGVTALERAASPPPMLEGAALPVSQASQERQPVSAAWGGDCVLPVPGDLSYSGEVPVDIVNAGDPADVQSAGHTVTPAVLPVEQLAEAAAVSPAVLPVQQLAEAAAASPAALPAEQPAAAAAVSPTVTPCDIPAASGARIALGRALRDVPARQERAARARNVTHVGAAAAMAAAAVRPGPVPPAQYRAARAALYMLRQADPSQGLLLEVEGKQFFPRTVLIDTGSEVTLLNEQTAVEWGLPTQPTALRMRTSSGDVVPAKGEVAPPVSFTLRSGTEHELRVDGIQLHLTNSANQFDLLVGLEALHVFAAFADPVTQSLFYRPYYFTRGDAHTFSALPTRTMHHSFHDVVRVSGFLKHVLFSGDAGSNRAGNGDQAVSFGVTDVEGDDVDDLNDMDQQRHRGPTPRPSQQQRWRHGSQPTQRQQCQGQELAGRRRKVTVQAGPYTAFVADFAGGDSDSDSVHNGGPASPLQDPPAVHFVPYDPSYRASTSYTERPTVTKATFHKWEDPSAQLPAQRWLALYGLNACDARWACEAPFIAWALNNAYQQRPNTPHCPSKPAALRTWLSREAAKIHPEACLLLLMALHAPLPLHYPSPDIAAVRFAADHNNAPVIPDNPRDEEHTCVVHGRHTHPTCKCPEYWDDALREHCDGLTQLQCSRRPWAADLLRESTFVRPYDINDLPAQALLRTAGAPPAFFELSPYLTTKGSGLRPDSRCDGSVFQEALQRAAAQLSGMEAVAAATGYASDRAAFTMWGLRRLLRAVIPADPLPVLFDVQPWVATNSIHVSGEVAACVLGLLLPAPCFTRTPTLPAVLLQGLQYKAGPPEPPSDGPQSQRSFYCHHCEEYTSHTADTCVPPVARGATRAARAAHDARVALAAQADVAPADVNDPRPQREVRIRAASDAAEETDADAEADEGADDDAAAAARASPLEVRWMPHHVTATDLAGKNLTYPGGHGLQDSLSSDMLALPVFPKVVQREWVYTDSTHHKAVPELSEAAWLYRTLVAAVARTEAVVYNQERIFMHALRHYGARALRRQLRSLYDNDDNLLSSKAAVWLYYHFSELRGRDTTLTAAYDALGRPLCPITYAHSRTLISRKEYRDQCRRRDAQRDQRDRQDRDANRTRPALQEPRARRPQGEWDAQPPVGGACSGEERVLTVQVVPCETVHMRVQHVAERVVLSVSQCGTVSMKVEPASERVVLCVSEGVSVTVRSSTTSQPLSVLSESSGQDTPVTPTTPRQCVGVFCEGCAEGMVSELEESYGVAVPSAAGVQCARVPCAVHRAPAMSVADAHYTHVVPASRVASCSELCVPEVLPVADLFGAAALEQDPSVGLDVGGAVLPVQEVSDSDQESPGEPAVGQAEAERCDCCLRPGHTADACWDLHPEQRPYCIVHGRGHHDTSQCKEYRQILKDARGVAAVRCGHCHKNGHLEPTCWELHPELRPRRAARTEQDVQARRQARAERKRRRQEAVEAAVARAAQREAEREQRRREQDSLWQQLRARVPARGFWQQLDPPCCCSRWSPRPWAQPSHCRSRPRSRATSRTGRQ